MIIVKNVFLCSLLFTSITLNAKENLALITVESSTIGVTNSKATEVSSVSYVNEKQVAEINPKHINELLQSIPGITSDVRTGEVVEIHMRGVGQQEFMWEDTGVVIIIDGVPLWQNGGKVRLNLSEIKSVKVIKGGASYLYGNTALAGAVIITTNKTKGEDSFLASIERGSQKSEDYKVAFTKVFDDFSFTLNGNNRKTDGFWVDSNFWSKSVASKLSYYINYSSDITLGIDKTKKYEQANRASVTGVSEARTTPKGNGRNSYQKDNNVNLSKYFLTYVKDFNNDSNLMVNVYSYDDKYDYTSSPQDITNDGNNDTYSNHTNKDILQKGIKLEYKKENDTFAYLIGLEKGIKEYSDNNNRLIDYSLEKRGKTTNYYKGETSKIEDNQDKKAIYLEFKYAFAPKFTTTFNIRHDIQDDEYTILSRDFNNTTWSNSSVKRDKTFKENSYRLGSTYTLNEDTTLFTNMSTGFRTPSVSQLFAGDVRRQKKSSTYHNNINIKTQKSLNYEIGIKGNKKLFENKINYTLSIFQLDNKDIIGKKDGTYFSGRDIYFDNIGDSKNRGLELSFKSDSLKTISFNLAYTYLKSEYTKHNPFMVSLKNFDKTYNIVGNELPRNPSHILDLYTTFKITKNLKVISEVYSKSNYYADETNLVKMPGYAILNLQTRYNTKIGKNNFEFFVKVNNVFDKHYYRTAFLFRDRNGDDVMDAEDASITVDPGRAFFTGIKYTF